MEKVSKGLHVSSQIKISVFLSGVLPTAGLQIFFQDWWAEVTHGAINSGSFSEMMGPSIKPLKKEDQLSLIPLMQVKSIAECSKGPFCITFDLQLATICC